MTTSTDWKNVSQTWDRVSLKSLAFGEKNDCTVKAVALAANVPYPIAHEALRLRGRKYRKGTHFYQYAGCLREDFGCVLIDRTIEFKKRAKTVRTLSRILPKDRIYLIRVRNHALVWSDGKIQDWTAGKVRRILDVFEVKRSTEMPKSTTAKKTVTKPATPKATTAKKKATKKKTAPKPATGKKMPTKNGLGRPRTAILKALKGAGKPLSRAQLSEKTGINTGFTDLLGHCTPEKQKEFSLANMKLIKIMVEDRDGKNVVVYEITAAGVKALAKELKNS